MGSGILYHSFAGLPRDLEEYVRPEHTSITECESSPGEVHRTNVYAGDDLVAQEWRAIRRGKVLPALVMAWRRDEVPHA